METLSILIVSEVSTNKIQFCSKKSGIFLSPMSKKTRLYQFSPQIQLEYMIYGQGTRHLICFHGFGQNFTVFKDLEGHLADYLIISINLLFHGQSKRDAMPKYLVHDEWQEIFSGLLDELNIEKFSILAYSLGGRYAASTLFAFSGRIDHCILVAPDGIVKRFWYELSTTPYGPEQLFRFFMKNPAPFFMFLNFLEKFRLMNVWTIRFSRSQLIEPEQRDMVLHSWITLRKLRLSQKKLAALINSSSFRAAFIFGKHDSIIRHRQHLSFLNQLQNAKVFNLEAGHAKLLNEAFKEIGILLSDVEGS